MEFRVLGSLEVVESGRRVDLGPPRQQALLALLLIHANQVVPLDRLIDQLWGEEPPPRATASLRAYVSHLRKALEPGRSPRDPPRVLVTQPPGYVLRLDPADVDAVRFEAGAAEGHRLLGEGRPAAAREVLARALGLWRGEALAEFAFEPFAEAEIRRLEELRLAAIEDRIRADLALGRHASAVPELEALAAEHPLREGLWGLLMVALYRCGRQAEALRAYRAARDVLIRQLGTEPGAELRRLEDEILAQAPSLEWQPTEEHRPELPGPALIMPPAPRPPEPERAPLVGRDPHLARLTAVLDGAVAGRGRMALLLGEPGIGKTRLVRELAARAGARGVQVAWGDAYEGAAAPALWPWVQLLRTLVAGTDIEQLRESLGASAGEVARILPELKELLPGLEAPPGVDPDTARFRLYEALTGFLLRRAARHPLLVVLDDLQWADDASLQLLRFVASRLRDAPVLLVGTYRPVEVYPAHPLSETLAALAREEVVERMALAGLGQAQVGELIAAAIGRLPASDVVAAVHDRTEGNPFYVSELVRLMMSEHALDDGRTASAETIPAGVGDVIRRRLARLPEDTNVLLIVAAVLGREFEVRELGAAAGLDLERTIENLEPAVLTGVLVEDRQRVGRLRFSHALVQETVYASVTAIRRVRLHARVGRALEELYGPDPGGHAAELARHFSLATAAGEAERAFRYALQAAEESTARFAYGQAEGHLGRALDALAGSAAGPERDRRELDVQTRRSVVLAVTRGYAAPEVAEACTRAHDLSLRVGDTRQLTASLWSLWAMWVVRAELDAGARFAGQLLDLGERTGSLRALLGGHQASGGTAVHRGKLGAGRDHLRRAIDLADAIDDPHLVDVFFQHPAVFCRNFAAVAAWLAGEGEAAVALMDEAIRLARDLAHPYTLAVALFFASWLYACIGDPGPVAEHAGEAIELSEAGGFTLMSAMSSVLRGWALARRGRDSDGCAEVTEGLARMEAASARMLRHFFLGLLADAHRRAGRFADGLAAVEEAISEADSAGERFYQAELYRLRAELLAAEGRNGASEVGESLARAVRLAQAQGARALELRAEETIRRLRRPG